MTTNNNLDKLNDQLNFMKFLKDKGLIDDFSTRFSTTRNSKGQYNNYLPINIDTKKKIVAYFYGKTFGVMEGINTFAVMHGLEKKFDVLVIPGNGNSYAGVNAVKKIIEGRIYTTPTIQGFEIMAHEMGHVFTGRNNKKITLLKKVWEAKGEQQHEFAVRELDGFCREKCACEYDSIGEIETMIIEKLFLLFLSEDEKCRKLLGQYGFNIDEYINEYEREHENMAYERVRNIVETKKILNKYNLTNSLRDEKEFDAFLSKLPDDSTREQFKCDMEQLSSNDAKYSFRYVVGEAISKYWFDRFKTADKEVRKELKNQFVEFWRKTDKFDIEQASALLCDGKTTKEVVSTYLEQTQIHKCDSNKARTIV